MRSYDSEVAEALQSALDFAGMNFDQIKSLPRSESSYMLPHWKGMGSFICGSKAFNMLRETAKRVLLNSKYNGRIDADDFSREFSDGCVRRFFATDTDLNNATMMKLIDELINSAGDYCKDITHYIPCHLGHAEGVTEFEIGEIKFVRLDVNPDYLEKALTSYVASKATPPGNENDSFVLDANKYYNSFGWMIIINIAGCDRKTSIKHASKKAGDALNCMHILLGSYYSNHMRAGGPLFSTDERSLITIADNDVTISYSRDWLGHALGENWWNILNSDRGDEIILSMGIAIEAGNRISGTSEISQRFLDASAWYGEATRDELPASSIVKLVTALEILFITKKTDEITKTMSERAAAFVFTANGENLFELRKYFAELHRLRSRIVHGARRPFDPSIEQKIYRADEYVRLAIQQFLLIAGSDAVRNSDQIRSRLEKWFILIESSALNVHNKGGLCEGSTS